MNLNKLLEDSKKILNESMLDNEVEVTSSDLMYMSTSIKKLETLAQGELMSFEEYNKVKDITNSMFDKMINDKINGDKAEKLTNLIPYTFYQNSSQEYRFLQLDENRYIFMTGDSSNKSSFKCYLSEDKCNTWVNIIAYDNLQTSSTLYSKSGIDSISFTTDEVEVDGVKSSCIRMFWIDYDHRVRTGTIVKGSNTVSNELIIDDTTISKNNRIISAVNKNNDIVCVYTVYNGNYYKSKALFKSGNKIDKVVKGVNKERLDERVNSWIECRVPDHNKNATDYLGNRVVVVDDIFFFAAYNASNRFYINTIFKNNYQEVVSNHLMYSTSNCNQLHLFLTTFKGNRIIIATSSGSEMFKLDVTNDNDVKKFKIESISYGISANSGRVSVVFDNGYYMKNNDRNVYYSKTGVHRIDSRDWDRLGVSIIESVDIIPVKSSSDSSGTIKLIRKDELVNDNITVKG